MKLNNRRLKSKTLAVGHEFVCFLHSILVPQMEAVAAPAKAMAKPCDGYTKEDERWEPIHVLPGGPTSQPPQFACPAETHRNPPCHQKHLGLFCRWHCNPAASQGETKVVFCPCYASATQVLVLASNMAFLAGSVDKLLHQSNKLLAEEVLNI